MNKRIIFMLGFVALVASGWLAAEDKPVQAPPDAAAASGDAIFATINGKEYSRSLFDRYYQALLRQANAQHTAVLREKALDLFVNMVLTAQDAEREGLTNDENVKQELEIQHLQLLSLVALQNAANTREPSDEDIQKAYEERYGKNKRIEYRARHILVSTEEEGKKLIAKLKGGADFAELAKTHSLGPTAKNGGELPWFSAGEMVQPFTDATAALKPGEYSTKPVHTQFGWHVILLEETRETDPPALEKVKMELIQALQQDTLSSYVGELRDKADLQLNPDLVKATDEGEAKSGDAK